MNKQTVNIRNPKNTRPWQHVLDPLVGYIMALEKALDSKLPQSFNFGPNDQSLTTEELVVIASSVIDFDYDLNYPAQNLELESKTLDLDSNLAKKILSWEPKLSQTEAIIRTFNWWEQVISKKISAKEACIADIEKVIGQKS
jgi:CDP-glucose 4,6-dehydratase